MCNLKQKGTVENAQLDRQYLDQNLYYGHFQSTHIAKYGCKIRNRKKKHPTTIVKTYTHVRTRTHAHMRTLDCKLKEPNKVS